MGFTLKIVEIDGEVGLIFPDELAAHLGAKVGDTLVARGESGVFHLSLEKPSEQSSPQKS